MSKILNVNDLCDAISGSTLDDETKNFLITALEATVTSAARILAEHYKIRCESAEYGRSFGGLFVAFRPKRKGQACPDVIDAGDEVGSWP